MTKFYAIGDILWKTVLGIWSAYQPTNCENGHLHQFFSGMPSSDSSGIQILVSSLRTVS